jgi:hypothetical protein
VKKWMLIVGTFALLGAAAVGAKIGLADCSDPAGNLTIVDPPCLGVEVSGDGYWYNDVVIHLDSTDTIVVDRVSSERVNQAAIWVKLDTESTWYSIGTGSHSYSSVSGGVGSDYNHTFHFRSAIITENEGGTCAVKLTPNDPDDAFARVFGWFTAPSA